MPKACRDSETPSIDRLRPFGLFLFAGLCLKLRLASEGHGKVFINLCHTKDIPAPEDISEQRLIELWNTASGTCEYRVPLSIGERREEPDKCK